MIARQTTSFITVLSVDNVLIGLEPGNRGVLGDLDTLVFIRLDCTFQNSKFPWFWVQCSCHQIYSLAIAGCMSLSTGQCPPAGLLARGLQWSSSLRRLHLACIHLPKVPRGPAQVIPSVATGTARSRKWPSRYFGFLIILIVWQLCMGWSRFVWPEPFS